MMQHDNPSYGPLRGQSFRSSEPRVRRLFPDPIKVYSIQG